MHKVLQGAEAVKKQVQDNDRAKEHLKHISSGFLNAIHMMETYRNQIAPVLSRTGSASEKVQHLMKNVEQEMNKRILDAKHSDTKAKRLKEKNLVLAFYKKNRENLLHLFQLDDVLNKSHIKEETVPNSLEIPDSSLSVSRSLMPQIPGDKHKEYIEYLKKNFVDVSDHKVAPKHLKATQSEFNLDKVQSIMDTDKEYKPALISKDFYILDGHHRWLADYNKDKETPVPVRMVHLPILDLMSLTHRFSGVQYKQVTDQKIPK